MQNKYSAALAWSEEDAQYVATSAEFPGLSGVAEAPRDALDELGEAIEMALEALNAANEPIPAPRALIRHSGQIRLRMPRSLHGVLASYADAEGVSLNTLAVSLLSRGVGLRHLPQATKERRPREATSRRNTG